MFVWVHGAFPVGPLADPVQLRSRHRLEATCWVHPFQTWQYRYRRFPAYDAIAYTPARYLLPARAANGTLGDVFTRDPNLTTTITATPLPGNENRWVGGWDAAGPAALCLSKVAARWTGPDPLILSMLYYPTPSRPTAL